MTRVSSVVFQREILSLQDELKTAKEVGDRVFWVWRYADVCVHIINLSGIKSATPLFLRN